ncbi:hypothetical protein BC629DRAFT_663784 [Irpex lacteus]|nr:hypothetical protein BC629DRAFT_663784 [Irpex lacteus]
MGSELARQPPPHYPRHPAVVLSAFQLWPTELSGSLPELKRTSGYGHTKETRDAHHLSPKNVHMPQPDTVHERKLRPSGRCQHTRAVVVERHTRLDIRRRSACNVQRKQILFSTSEASHLLGLSLQMLTVRLQMPSWNGDIDPSVRFLDKLFVLTISGTADARDDVKSLRKLRTYCLDRPLSLCGMDVV